ncbi:hypothetical protein [Mesorhizobium sp.]|uniref:hypothetical protein n=1 Tax=Mesorhizobium sp. TaxID=1871066 RepID=UPI001201A664|nr:hypothetical protein [Mesorhizobium sp.]TIL31974.1 MAG: hypothetical protein E5Y85_18535 [Mesorhizobium sp.]
MQQADSVAGSLGKSFAAMLALADACDRKQNPEAASPLPTNLIRSRFIGSRQKAARRGGQKVGPLTEALHAACKIGRRPVPATAISLLDHDLI